MSKKPSVDAFQQKISRNDRFAQMSHQEKVIEQKKREILAKLEAKEKAKSEANKSKTTENPKQTSKSIIIPQKEVTNVFSNDGSFLEQFRQLKDKKPHNPKPKPSNQPKDHSDKGHNEEKTRFNRFQVQPKDRPVRRTFSRFSSDKTVNFEPKITISDSFSSVVHQQPRPYEIVSNVQPSQITVTPQNVTGQPLLKNLIATTYTEIIRPTTETVMTAQPVLLDVPPPQIVQANTLVIAEAHQPQNVLMTPILTTVNLPPPLITTNMSSVPPPCLPTVELASIPPPNPIQVQNIPQPEPLNALNIPQPAPIQVQNIPTPNSIQLNEIPNPKPLDLMAIPTPNDDTMQEQDGTMVIPSSQSVLLHTLPPPSQLQQIQATPTNQLLPTFSSITVSLPVVQVSTAPPTMPTIPSLMAQPILPPPGMGLNVNVNCPPPTMQQGFVGRMPPVNVPPPMVTGFKSLNAVFPPGSAEYESMASLGRMVAKCGDSIEDMVRQHKNQDPNLWFLFHKESAAYQQYRQLIAQLKREEELTKEQNFKQEEMYEPEQALDDIDCLRLKAEIKEEKEDLDCYERKRKRRSRWGDKDLSVPPPAIFNQIVPIQSSQNNVLLSKVTRTDPGLIQYAINTYGSANLTEEVWKKAEDNYKINLLYQDMVKKRDEAEFLMNIGRNKYEYDSDEDTEGGTWEHKARDKEMVATQLWAQELNRQAEGKHHIGDFLPPEELKRFMEKSCAVKEGRQPSFSDYKEFKIKEDNIGFKMLQKLGWMEGQGLGTGGNGIVEPINKAQPREHTQGLGLNEVEEDEDEYESYRRRMMLAYRFRPNPLNNPRRPYY